MIDFLKCKKCKKDVGDNYWEIVEHRGYRIANIELLCEKCYKKLK